MIIIYVDIILLIILLLLVIFTCGYCAYRVHHMQQNGQVAILLRPTKVLFSHRTEDNSEQLRTVVAYRNPFTGDYCVHKNREPKGYLNSTQSLASTDSGLSDEYEPLNLPPLPEDNATMPGQVHDFPHTTRTDDYSLKKTWKWDYTEYQI
ncbi:uncharacterized protein LOC121727919 [Aricia agestis]|uniref:uncharacterized protein LOC121727919 n=1 Tax=Aricia agestis TaxID=91739 RepID=UPI001C207DB1|nr:uncharacterized protein LOC121727919 [Aricia agestis]